MKNGSSAFMFPKYRPFTAEGSGGEKFFEMSKTFTIQGTTIHPILAIVT
jgi:hypothetical protein